MEEELQLINHYILSKDPNFLSKNGADLNFFVTTLDIVLWIEGYKDKFGGMLPTLATLDNQFDEFDIKTELDAVPFLVGTIKENRLYMDYKPVLTQNATMVSEGNTLQAIWDMRNNIDNLLKRYGAKTGRYDWVKNSMDRYDHYMLNHGIEGLVGITTGLDSLDRITGGWLDDDSILLAGRTNEGKSLVANYFAYVAWLSFLKKKRNDPIIIVSTEMNESSVAYRLDALRSHFSNRAMRRGKLGDPSLYKEYLEELQKKENSLIILTPEQNGGNAFTTSDIRSIIESERPGMVFVDQLYDISDGTGERDIRKRIVNVSNQLREINLITKTPTMVVAQAGRDSAKDAKKDKNASPELHQIQESDNPAQKSTKALTLRFIDGVFKLTVKKNREDVKNVDVYVRADIDAGIWDEVDEATMVF